MQRYLILAILIATVVSAEKVFLQPGPEGKDTCVETIHPYVNYGDECWADLGKMIYENRMLIEWDVSGIPDDAEVTDAVMELYCYNFWGEPTGEIKFCRITENWLEDYVTWNNQPPSSSDVIATGAWPEVGEWATFDVTEFIQGWYSDDYPNQGFIGIGSEVGCAAAFWTSDYTEDVRQRPKLTVTYEVEDPDDAVAPASLGIIKAVYR